MDDLAYKKKEKLAKISLTGDCLSLLYLEQKMFAFLLQHLFLPIHAEFQLVLKEDLVYYSP